MARYIGKRLGLLVLTLVIILIMVFFLLQLMPGYPRAIQAQIDQAKTQAEINAIIAAYTNNHQNALERFGHYVTGIFHGDFGEYYVAPTQSIPSLFLRPMRYTLMVTGPAFLLGTAAGLIFGFIAGYKRGKWQDVTLNVVATFFAAVPSFVLATFLIVFGRKAGLQVDWQTAEQLGKTTAVLIMPIIIVTITSFSTLTYFIRNEVVEVLTSDYIAIARAKGVRETQLFFRHVLRNVSIPLVSIVLPSFISIIMGSMIIEIFFGIPGSSHIFANAVSDREVYVVMFSTLFFTALGLVVQLITDIIYALLDPRIKLAEASRRPVIKTLKAFMARRQETKVSLINKEVSRD